MGAGGLRLLFWGICGCALVDGDRWLLPYSFGMWGLGGLWWQILGCWPLLYGSGCGAWGPAARDCPCSCWVPLCTVVVCPLGPFGGLGQWLVTDSGQSVLFFLWLIDSGTDSVALSANGPQLCKPDQPERQVYI